MDPVSLSSRVLSWLSLINHDEMTSSRVTRARVLPAATPERLRELVIIARPLGAELIAGRVLAELFSWRKVHPRAYRADQPVPGHHRRGSASGISRLLPGSGARRLGSTAAGRRR